MLWEELIEAVRSRMSQRRFIHTLGVVKAADWLARRYEVNVEQARLAALLHDSAKEMPIKEMQALIKRAGIMVDSEVFENSALLHGEAGAVLAVTLFEVNDMEVLEAIRVHTTGKVGMSPLDKVLFVADYIEENRDFPGVEVIREMAQVDLDLAVLTGYDGTISSLLNRKTPIYFKTILGRNDIIFQINRKKGAAW